MKRPLIVDCFPYFNEVELVQARIDYLSPVVDRFVIVALDVTHSGEPYSPPFPVDLFNDPKVVYENYPNAPNGRGQEANWERLRYQRESILKPLRYMPDETTVLLSDLDEIPRRELIQSLREERKPIADGQIACFMMDYYYYDPTNLVTANQPGGYPWPGTKMCNLGTMRKLGVTGLRQVQAKDCSVVLPDAGWHCSYFGGASQVRQKMGAICENHFRESKELINAEEVSKRLAAHADVYGRDDMGFVTIEPRPDLPDELRRFIP